MLNPLRTAVLLALLVVSAVVWAVYRTTERAEDANRSVSHTQEVLAAIEAVRSAVADAEASARAATGSAAPDAAGLERANASIEPAVDRVAALTADNPSQQALVTSLREKIAAFQRAAGDELDAGRIASDPGRSSAAVQQATSAARLTLRAMVAEESRLLASRAQSDRQAMRMLQRVSLALVAAAGFLLVFIVERQADLARRERAAADALARARDALEARVDAQSSELRDANERLRSIIDSGVDGIIVIDTKGTIESFNPGAERQFGYPAGEVVGRNVSVLMPSPDHEQHDRYLSRYLETGRGTVIGLGREVTGRRRDGTTFPLHLSVGEMWIKGERKFTGMLHDLTIRAGIMEELRASEARWRAIVDSAVDGIIVIDAHGRVESFNPAAERLFGYAEQEVIGRNVSMLMPSPYREEHDRYLASHLATGTQKVIGAGREVTALRRDGSTVPVHLAVGRMTVNGAPKFTGILHDLSGRVQMEEQLREQTALARLGEMAAVIAHEVKNPLAGVRGAIQVIGTRLPKDSKDAAMVKEIISRVDALNDLMRDMLLFARPPVPKPAPVDVASIVSSTADLLGGDPALKGVSIRLDGVPPPIMADPELLKIVLTNVLVNGAHAMRGRGTIHVSMAQARDMCRIAITDEGPGIPDEVREKIFTPFFTTKARGSGLGLPTAKRLIEAHHGQISIHCPAGGGTVVTIELPADQAA